MPTLHSNGSLGLSWTLAGVQCTAFGNFALQSSKVTFEGDETTVKDASGNDIIWYGYNPKRQVSFEYTVTGASANTSASITAPTFGTLLTVTDTTGLSPATGSWIVKKSDVDQANTQAAKVTVQATSYPAITT